MKTALTIIGGVFATLAAAVVIFYLGWLSPPAADDVCDNVERIAKVELTRARADVPAAPAQLHRACMARATRAPEFGRAVWVKKLKCMRDAEDMPSLDRCDDIRSI